MTDLTPEDDAALAAEYDRARGYDRPLAERSAEAHRMAEGAPVITYEVTAPGARNAALARCISAHGAGFESGPCGECLAYYGQQGVR